MKISFYGMLVLCLSPCLAYSEHVAIKCSDLPKCDIIGATGAKVFSRRMFLMKRNPADRVVILDDASEEVVEYVYYGLHVHGVGSTRLTCPVQFSYRDGEVGYDEFEKFNRMDEPARIWAFESGKLTLAPPSKMKVSVDNLCVGSKMELMWKKQIYLDSEVGEGEFEETVPALKVIPGLGRPITIADIGCGVDVIGSTGVPLGTVCCIKGKWDKELRSKSGWLFRVKEVNGKVVDQEVNGEDRDGVAWSQSELLIHDFATGKDVSTHSSGMKYRGQEWTFLGCEIGEYEGSPPGFPQGGQQKLRSDGFYTQMILLKKCQ